jgi:hypothetical protein
MFICLNDFLTKIYILPSTLIKIILVNHIYELLNYFHKYFPNLNENKEYDFIRIPFTSSSKYDRILRSFQEELI